MGKIESFEKVKLVIGILYSELIEKKDILQEHVFPLLEEHFGEIDFISEKMAFSYTHYYDEEIPPPIYKRILAFKELIDPELLSHIKITTNSFEVRWQKGDLRPINLDPGILNLSHLILATTKDRGHRIPLKDGIYGELTLLYANHAFQRMDWTYDDFATEEYRKVLLEIREIYRIQRNQNRKNR